MSKYLTGLNEKEFRRYQNHPVRDVLQRAAGGAHIYPDSLDRLGLPAPIRKALEEAIERVTPDPATGRRRVRNVGIGSPDHLGSEIFTALNRLDPHWETPDEKRHRLASEGDASALASLDAEREATERLADRITGRNL